MSDQRKDLPPESAANFGARVRETLQVFLGRRGDPLDRGVTVRDLAGLGVAGLVPGARPGMGGGNLWPGRVIDGDASDLTPPPTPDGFRVTGGLSNVMVECNPAVYTMGRGPGLTVLYGVRRTAGDALPVFSQAAKLAEFSGPVYAFAAEPASTWAMWLTWRTRNGVESVAPAGGTNGLAVSTGQDVASIMQVLSSAQGDDTTGFAAPFYVQKTPTVINGVAVPAGVYVLDGFIANGTIDNAKIGVAAIDDAKIANLSAAKLTAGDGTIGGVLKSSNFVVGTQGWRVMPDGTAEFSGAVMRGGIYASYGSIGGININAGSITSPNYTWDGGGFYLGAEGLIVANNIIARGTIYAQAGSIANLNITSGGINSGGFTGYDWPPSGQSGFHLSASGLLAGNANDGKYLQISTDGTISAPNFSVSNGNAYFSGSGSFTGNVYANGGYFNGELRAVSGVFVNTVNVAGNAITVSNAYSGAFSDWNVGPVLSIYMPQPGWVTAVVTATSANSSSVMLLDSTPICTVTASGFQNPAVFLTASKAVYVGAGTHYVYANGGGTSGSVTLFGMMR